MSASANITLATKNRILRETLASQPCSFSFSCLSQPTSVLIPQGESCIFRHTLTDTRKSSFSSLWGHQEPKTWKILWSPLTLVQNEDNFSGLNKNQMTQSERIHTYTAIETVFSHFSSLFSPFFSCVLPVGLSSTGWGRNI